MVLILCVGSTCRIIIGTLYFNNTAEAVIAVLHGVTRAIGFCTFYPQCILIRIVNRVLCSPFILFIVKVYLYRLSGFLIILAHHCAAVKIKTMLYS